MFYRFLLLKKIEELPSVESYFFSKTAGRKPKTLEKRSLDKRHLIIYDFWENSQVFSEKVLSTKTLNSCFFNVLHSIKASFLVATQIRFTSNLTAIWRKSLIILSDNCSTVLLCHFGLLYI